jgi:hypothetical protein
MLNCEDYKQLSNRFAQLAIASSAPTVAKALMAIAFDYAPRASAVTAVARAVSLPSPVVLVGRRTVRRGVLLRERGPGSTPDIRPFSPASWRRARCSTASVKFVR